jgi:hypothetical protein
MGQAAEQRVRTGEWRRAPTFLARARESPTAPTEPPTGSPIGSPAGCLRGPNRGAQRRFRVPRRARPKPGPGGSSPQPGVMGPDRARVPGRDKARISQRIRENRSGALFRPVLSLQRVSRPGLGIVRFSAPRKPARNLSKMGEKPQRKGRRRPRSGVDRFHAARCLGVPV